MAKTGFLELLRTRTAWIGLLTIGAGIVEWVFDGDRSAAFEKILLGAAMITGRHAIAKGR